MTTIEVQLNEALPRECTEGLPVSAVLPAAHDSNGLPYVAALVNNDVVSLSYPLTVRSRVVPLTVENPHGWLVYRRSICFLLAKTVKELYHDAHFSVEHSLGPGLFCSFSINSEEDGGITPEQVSHIEKTMREQVAQDLPIERHKISFTDAVDELSLSGQIDKLNSLKHRNPPRVVIHRCGEFHDLAHGPLVGSTGILATFKLIHYAPGFVLHMPKPTEPTALPVFEDQPHLFHIIQEHKEWGRILGVSTVGRLNEIINSGEIQDFIRTAEALHEKKLASIADQIASREGAVRIVLIAGPSSAGKTTSAKRLTTHLRVNGFHPLTLSTDDYFVGEERNPIGEDGRPDYEHVEAVDIELFNRHLSLLIEGNEVALPRFNFHTKQSEPSGRSLRLRKDQILLIEGIHGLNPRLTHMIPSENKFKIYVSALTQLSVDANNRISTTDNRLMRRMVRDHQFRGHTAIETLRMWPMVRRGEERWIFPFQREANATFNSALDYELAVLKPYVEPLLMTVKPSHPEYAEARRLSEFLLSFLGVPHTMVPPTSILREYIGGSSLRYA